MSSSSSSGSEEEDALKFEKTAETTTNAVQQEGEQLDLSPFLVDDPENNAEVMIEVPAGSNIWYQGYLMGESSNEWKVRFPSKFHMRHRLQVNSFCRPATHSDMPTRSNLAPSGTKKQPERTEWINKRSSRFNRIGMQTHLWKYIPKTDGAWYPKGTPPPAIAQARAKPSAETRRQKHHGQKRKPPAPAGREAGGSRQATPASDAKVESEGLEPKKAKKTKEEDAEQVSGLRKSAQIVESDDTSDASPSQDSDDSTEDAEFEAARRGHEALANWFKTHFSSLAFTLSGSAESGCKDPTSLKGTMETAAQGRKDKKAPAAPSRLGTLKTKRPAAGPGSDTEGAAARSPMSGHGSQGAFGIAVPGHRSLPNPHRHKPPTRPVRVESSLIEDDIFGGALKGETSNASPKNSFAHGNGAMIRKVSSNVSQNTAAARGALAQPSRLGRPAQHLPGGTGH